MAIPEDLILFLSKPENRRLTLSEGEVREIEFFAPEDLKLESFTVNSHELYRNGPLETDPDEKREYEGYSLIKDCADYSPEGIIAWFPAFQAYGSADTDHGRIMIYPGVSWTEIMTGPTWYINGQWYPDRVDHEEINPWQ